MRAKEFPQSAFQLIALNGPPNFPTDCQPEPGRAVLFLQNNDDEMAGMAFSPLCLNDQISPPMPHAAGRGKRPRANHRWTDKLLGRNSDDQPLAPFSPTALEDDLAIFGLHPAAETMSSFATDFARLISAFHDLTDSL